MWFCQFCSLITRQAGASVLPKRGHTELGADRRDTGEATQKRKSPATVVQVTTGYCGRAAIEPRLFLGPNVLCSGSWWSPHLPIPQPFSSTPASGVTAQEAPRWAGSENTFGRTETIWAILQKASRKEWHERRHFFRLRFLNLKWITIMSENGQSSTEGLWRHNHNSSAKQLASPPSSSYLRLLNKLVIYNFIY